jgi:hypothetical protein
LAIRRRRFPEFLVAEWPLLATGAVLMAMFSLANNTQIGIRHILPVLAICVVLAGGAFATFVESSWWQKTLLCACVLYVAVSVASYFPHMIPYFNEIVRDRRTAYYYLADSNLDWDQDLWVVEAFLKKNVGVVLDPPEPVTGWVLVRGNLMAGMVPPKADYWLRQRGLRPVAQVGYGHFLFQVPAASRGESTGAPFVWKQSYAGSSRGHQDRKTGVRFLCAGMALQWNPRSAANEYLLSIAHACLHPVGIVRVNGAVRAEQRTGRGTAAVTSSA